MEVEFVSYNVITKKTFGRNLDTGRLRTCAD